MLQDLKLPVKYKSNGCSLHYSKCGGLQYLGHSKNIRPRQMYKDADSLPLKKYDVVINDFDAITALVCKLQNVHSVQLGHQWFYLSCNLCPRQKKKYSRRNDS
jgi:hypothetical protein